MNSVRVGTYLCRLSLALLVGWTVQVSNLPAEAQGVSFTGYVTTSPSPVRFVGEDVFAIRTPAGLFSAEERRLIVERNLNNALKASVDRSPDAVQVEIVNHLPVIRLGGKHVVTIDHLMAADYGTTKLELADRFATNLRRVLLDQGRVFTYVSQLDGDFLTNPYTPPNLREQWQAARRNHAASFYRKDLPTDMVSSGSLKEQGFKALNKRDPVTAEAFFRAALRAEPENQRALYGLGLSQLKQNMPNRALMSLEIARYLDPKDAEVHIAIGQTQEALGHDQDAIRSYQSAKQLQPENPEPLLYIADMREDRDQIGDSVKELGVPEARASEYVRLKRKDQLTWRLKRTY